MTDEPRTHEIAAEQLRECRARIGLLLAADPQPFDVPRTRDWFKGIFNEAKLLMDHVTDEEKKRTMEQLVSDLHIQLIAMNGSRMQDEVAWGQHIGAGRDLLRFMLDDEPVKPPSGMQERTEAA